MEQTLRDLTENKSIILVGNSVEMLQHSMGDIIDSYDTVVRFGNGIPNSTNSESIGKRTDIWVTGFLRYKKRRFYPENIPVLFNRSRIHLDKKPQHYPDYKVIEMFSDKEMLNIFDLVGAKNGEPDGQRPSAGFVTIEYFLQKINFSTLTLVGFDFFSKALSITAGQAKPYSWHIPMNTLDKNPHAYREKKIVSEYHKKKEIEWIILSDLIQEELDLS
jgi:hypothetical protein